MSKVYIREDGVVIFETDDPSETMPKLEQAIEQEAPVEELVEEPVDEPVTDLPVAE